MNRFKAVSIIIWGICLPILVFVGCGLLSPLAALFSDLRLVNLRCEYQQNPPGIDELLPRLSWNLQAASDKRELRQSAYHILVSSTPEKLAKEQGDLWDSGRVESDRQLHIIYAGKPLTSRMQCFWKVRVWNQNGRQSKWSQPSAWTMSLLKTSDWQAKWIADANSVVEKNVYGPLNGYQCEFAKSADTAKWVTIDLGKPQSFDAVKLFPARPYDWTPDTPGFLFPVRFKIETAMNADFSDAKVVLDRTAKDEPNPDTNAPLYRFASATGQFVRLTVTKFGLRDGENFAFALAEIQVLNGENNIAKLAKVSAQDSVETGQWAKVNLTDGVLTAVKPRDNESLPASMVHKSFQINHPIKRATAYASALGLYELRLNGQRVGEKLLTPEWTSYRKHVQYQVYDVTALLCQGENAASALLGEGWYAGRLMITGRFAYGTHPRFLLQLEIEFTDGQRQTIITDNSWRTTTDGPIRSAGIYDGEVYDARKETKGWDTAGFDASLWQTARAFDINSPRLVGQRNEPIQVTKELAPVKMTEPKPGVFVFDFGQNMVGWCRVKAVGAAGKTVTIRHAEMLNDDGTIYTANLRTALQTDSYTPAADGNFVFEPHFTYHGFRYVELTGLTESPTNESILGRVFHSSSPIVGSFECSDSSLNRLMQNIQWTQRSNMMSVPTDCPQRDERLGWMGDIQSFAQTAAFNMDMAAFFSKSAQDMRDDQASDGRFSDFAPNQSDSSIPGSNGNGWTNAFSGAPAWADAGVIVPWRAYQNYADIRLLEQHFEAARKWVDYIHNQNPNLIWERFRNNDYGDWLNGDTIKKQEGWPEGGAAIPSVVFATAFFAHSTELVAKMAELLGRSEDAYRYGRLSNQIKSVFNQRYVKPDGRIEGDTQSGYALALSFNLLPENLRSKAAQYLVENIRKYNTRLSTGIQTTPRAMLELSNNGYSDVAWQLITNRTFPSWLYMIDNGATTIWERWDGYVKGRGFQDAGMNSFNHWALGAVGEWMWRNIAGLNPDDSQPGWKHFSIAPKPGGGVTWAKCEYQSIRGPIAVSWSLDKERIVLKVSIPPNTTAAVYVPTSQPNAVTESGLPIEQAKGVKFIHAEKETAVYEIGSGSYVFEAPFAVSGASAE
jgi:alpha-L-rhamnosidase